MAVARPLSITATFEIQLDLAAIKSYTNEIKKSGYRGDAEKQYKLTSKIIENIQPYIKKGIIAVSFNGLDDPTKNQLAIILKDHACNVIMLFVANMLPELSSDELEAYFDIAIDLCTTKDDKHEFQIAKQLNLGYFQSKKLLKPKMKVKCQRLRMVQDRRVNQLQNYLLKNFIRCLIVKHVLILPNL